MKLSPILYVLISLVFFSSLTANDQLYKQKCECKSSKSSSNQNTVKTVLSRINQLSKGKKKSISEGRLADGHLTHAKELPLTGYGYYVARPERGSHFGNDRLIYGLMVLGAYLHDELGCDENNKLRVNDISNEFGRKLKSHVNHQMGLDVDLSLFAKNQKGENLNSAWITFDENGLSRAKIRVFDDARNWEVVRGILVNPVFGEIRSLYISNPLKSRMIKYAKSQYEEMPSLTSKQKSQKKEFKALIEKANSLLKEPKSSPHANHFHLSLKQ
ncbi:MAG: penicillin-insensitive murein endopeptidase [Lentisphaeraceae bacterium]|nr:penicillin-insensitive murein endopeptidase [Lentisphaeraceae bacterium]